MMSDVPFKSDFDDKMPFPSDYFDFDVLRKGIYDAPLNTYTCTYEQVRKLLESDDDSDVMEAFDIIDKRAFTEALPRLEEIAIGSEDSSIRLRAVRVIKAIGGREAQKIIHRLNPPARKSVDDLIRIALYDEDYGQREDAVLKLMRRSSEKAKAAVAYLTTTEHRELILGKKSRW